MKPTERLEEHLSRSLFACRFLALFAVFGALLAAVLLLLKGTVEILYGFGVSLGNLAQFTKAEHNAVILAVIPAVDNYLFATVLIIFSAGIYRLFIGKIDPALSGSTSHLSWLKVENLDDLRTQVCAGVIVILIINFFDIAFSLKLDRPLDLLLLSGGIFLIAAALFLTYRPKVASDEGLKDDSPSPKSGS
jgi:uncharacterized membrane protein YqhA